jgi:signal peptidase II
VASRFRNFIPDYNFLFSVAGLIILIDQITKWIVRVNIPFGQSWMPLEWLAPYARIVNWYNTGAAFGMFQRGGGIFAVLAVIVSSAILIYYPLIPRSDKFLRLALAMQMAGALGNLIDRMTVGAVTDFVSVWTFPVFNVADASISLGVVILLLPYLPHLPAEWSVYQITKRARQINSRRRVKNPNHTSKATPEDEAVSLGVLEILFEDASPIREFILSQRAKRIHRHYLHYRQPSPGKVRQNRNPL